jgi:peptidylprolyl isomerase
VLLQAGTRTPHPGTASTVLVHSTGWTTEGAECDRSVRKGEPFQTPLTRVIPGWTEGVQLLVKGEKRRFWIPAKLAYEGMPGRPQGVLIFDIELLDFK